MSYQRLALQDGNIFRAEHVSHIEDGIIADETTAEKLYKHVADLHNYVQYGYKASDKLVSAEGYPYSVEQYGENLSFRGSTQEEGDTYLQINNGLYRSETIPDFGNTKVCFESGHIYELTWNNANTGGLVPTALMEFGIYSVGTEVTYAESGDGFKRFVARQQSYDTIATVHPNMMFISSGGVPYSVNVCIKDLTKELQDTQNVRYDIAQNATEEQKQRARQNIDTARRIDVEALLAAQKCINYGYDVPFSFEPISGYMYYASRDGVKFQINSTDVLGYRWLKISGQDYSNHPRVSGSSQIASYWTEGVSLQNGHYYIVRGKLLSGSVECLPTEAPWVSVYPVGSGSSINLAVQERTITDSFWTIFQAGSNPVNLAFRTGRNNSPDTATTFNNAVYDITLCDITDAMLHYKAIAPVDYNPTISEHIAGDVFVANEHLYKAKVNMPVGTTIDQSDQGNVEDTTVWQLICNAKADFDNLQSEIDSVESEIDEIQEDIADAQDNINELFDANQLMSGENYADWLYKNIFGDDSDWTADHPSTYAGASLVKKGRTFHFNTNGTDQSVVLWYNLTGTEHGCFNGDGSNHETMKTYIINNRPNDFVSIWSKLSDIRANTASSAIAAVNMYANWIQESSSSARNNIKLCILFRRENPDTGEMEYSNVYEIDTISTTHTNTTGNLCGSSEYGFLYNTYWDKYSDVAIYLGKYGSYPVLDLVLEPVCQERPGFGVIPAIKAQYAAEGKPLQLAQTARTGTLGGVTYSGNGQLITLNGTSGSSASVICILGEFPRVRAGSTAPNSPLLVDGPFDVMQGHTYRMRVRCVSGTQSTTNKPYVGIFDTDGTNLFTVQNNIVTSGFACVMGNESYFVMDRAQIGQIGLVFYKNTTYNNMVVSIEIQDVSVLHDTDDTAIAPHNTNIATQEYVAGDLLMKDSKLYKANTAIVSGTQIQNSDIVPTSVAQELNTKANNTDVVKHSEEQALSIAHKIQAKENIDAANELDAGSKIHIDTSSLLSGYPAGNIGDLMTITSSDKSKTIEKACYVKAGKTYTMVVHNGSSVLATTARNTYIVSKNNVVLQRIPVATKPGITIPVTFVATSDGWLYPCIDGNYTGFDVYGGEAFAIQNQIGLPEERIAIHQHAVGDLFMLEGCLYKAVDEINVGDTISDSLDIAETINAEKQMISHKLECYDADLYEQLFPQVPYWGSSSDQLVQQSGLQISRVGRRVYINGTSTQSVFIKLSGEYDIVTSGASARSWSCSIPLEDNVMYTVVSTLISGTVTGSISTVLYDTDNSEVVKLTGFGGIPRAWTSGLGKLFISMSSGVVFDNAVIEVTLKKTKERDVFQKTENAASIEELSTVAATSDVATYYDQGTINSTTGITANSSTRIRSGWISVPVDSIITLSPAEGYGCNGRLYSSDNVNTYIESFCGDQWMGFSTHCAISGGQYIRVVARKLDDTAIVPEEGVPNITITAITSSGEIVNTLTGTTLTVAAIPGVRYVCSSALSQLTFTPSSSGVCSVRFTAGSNMVLDIPNTVKMPEWWTGVEEGRTYEISIEDGVYGVVTSWA